MDWPSVRLTLQLACATTAILFVVGLPLAWWIVTTKSRARIPVEAIASLPLVLPPTVVGFYILMMSGRDTFLGSVWESLAGSTLPFSFAGILLGSVLYNLPFIVRPFMASLSRIDRRLMEASWCLGESRWKTFWRIVFPLSRTGIVGGVLLCFAHCIGEFGVVLMVGGNIPGVTRTLSIAIYDDVQALDYAAAGQTSLVLLICSFVLLCVTQWLTRKERLS